MSIFGGLFSAGIALKRLAHTVDECLNCLNRCVASDDEKELYKAAWLYVFGISDSCEKWGWNPFSTKIFIPNHSSLGRVTISHASVMVLAKLTGLSKQYGVEKTVSAILEGKEEFQDHEYLVSSSLKEKLTPNI